MRMQKADRTLIGMTVNQSVASAASGVAGAALSIALASFAIPL